MKSKVMSVQWCLLMLVVFFCSQANATEQDGNVPLEQITEKGTNPPGDVTRLQVQSTYRQFKNGTDQYVILPRLFLPYEGFIVPGLGTGGSQDYYSLLRVETSMIQQHNSQHGAVNAFGMADTNLTHGVVFPQAWGSWGLGYGMLLPTATEKALGMGKWQAGPSGIISYQGFPGWQITAFAQQFSSFAGDDNRAAQNFMSFQPIVTKRFAGGYFLIFDPIMKFDWKNHDYIIPLNLGFGMAFSKSLIFYLEPEYVVNGSTRDTFAIRLNFTIMP